MGNSPFCLLVRLEVVGQEEWQLLCKVKYKSCIFYLIFQTLFQLHQHLNVPFNIHLLFLSKIHLMQKTC